MDFGIIVNSIISILESKASFITTVAFEAGFSVLLYKHPDNETYLFWVIVLGALILLTIIIYCYKFIQTHIQRKEDERNNQARREQAEKEKQEKEFAAAKYVYDRLNNDSQTLLKNICKIAQSSTLEGKFIIKYPDEYYQIIFSFKNLLYTDYELADWVDYDEYGDSFCFTIKSPLDKIIRSEV